MCISFKRTLKFNSILFSLLSIMFFNLVSLFAQDEETGLEEMFAIFTEEEIVVSALKKPRTVLKSPAIMSVITAKQIKQMGFRTLTDVLETVPGFDIFMDKFGIRELAVRGVRGEISEKVKVLVDGHSINDQFSGGAMADYDDLVVENAKRIEVIRGPGSALYGQNAFLAVVNVVTKDTDDIDGFQWTVSGGSFDTQNYNMLFGKEVGDLKISGFFDYFDTEGFSENIERDILPLDPFPPLPFEIRGSKSPGRSQNEKEKTDLNLKLSYKNLEIMGKYMKRRREAYIGISHALTDDTMARHTNIFAELNYKLYETEKLNVNTKVYYDQLNFNPIIEQFPNGTELVLRVGPFVIPVSNYPDGVEGISRLKIRTIGFENQLNYKVFEGNELTFGFQYEWIHQGDINYDTNFHPITLAPLPTFRDFSSDLPFMRGATRQIWALYLQDEWSITDDIDLTVGVRHDHYTRFEGTTNPRFGLVWRFMEDAHLKLLFATAFRAPNFNELFLINNPVTVGNPNLDPEKVNTFEVGLGYNFTRHIRGNINYFFNRIRDRIVLRGRGPQRFKNSGGLRIKGVEAEIKADFGNDNYVYANYTFQDAEETRHRNRLHEVPVHKANLGVNVGFWKYANANLHTFVSGPRPRGDGDARRNMPSHTLVNLTLIGRNFMDNFEVRGSVFNLFDKGYEDPSPQDTVPKDYPQPERSFVFELRYQF